MIFNSSFFRRSDWEKVGGYNENMVYGWEDYDFWLSILELGREVVQIPEPLYLYRQVSNSRSERLTRDRQINCYAQLFHNHPRLYSDHISTLFEHIVEMREDIHQTHARLGQTIEELRQTHGKLGQSLDELTQSQDKLALYRQLLDLIQTSKFWKLRNGWISLKQLLKPGMNGSLDKLLAEVAAKDPATHIPPSLALSKAKEANQRLARTGTAWLPSVCVPTSAGNAAKRCFL